MKRVLAAVAGFLALTGAASAQTDGFVTTNVNLRAGPGTDYPAVVILGAGTPLDIFGCLDSYSWCDVDWRGYRGWVAAQYLEYDYRGRRVVLPDYAPMIGVPIVGFSVDNYWGRYYRDRPWYGDRARWSQPPGRRPPPGGWNGGPAGPPPGGGWNGGPPPRGGWNEGRPSRGDWNDGPSGGGWNGGGRPPRGDGGPPPQQGQQPPHGDWNGGGGRPPRGNGGPPPQQGQQPPRGGGNGGGPPPRGNDGRPPQQSEQSAPQQPPAQWQQRPAGRPRAPQADE